MNWRTAMSSGFECGLAMIAMYAAGPPISALCWRRGLVVSVAIRHGRRLALSPPSVLPKRGQSPSAGRWRSKMGWCPWRHCQRLRRTGPRLRTASIEKASIGSPTTFSSAMSMRSACARPRKCGGSSTVTCGLISLPSRSGRSGAATSLPCWTRLRTSAVRSWPIAASPRCRGFFPGNRRATTSL